MSECYDVQHQFITSAGLTTPFLVLTAMVSHSEIVSPLRNDQESSSLRSQSFLRGSFLGCTPPGSPGPPDRVALLTPPDGLSSGHAGDMVLCGA